MKVFGNCARQRTRHKFQFLIGSMKALVARKPAGMPVSFNSL